MSSSKSAGEPVLLEVATGPPLVSVVIMCRPGTENLDDAIGSVTAQDHPAFEVLILGDARHPPPSTGFRSIAYEGDAPESGLNEATLVCRGTYIVFLDAEDRLLSGALRTGAQSLEAHPACGFTSGRHRTVSGDGSVLWEAQPAARISGDHYVELVRGDYRIDLPGAVMYRRSALEAVQGFDPSLTSAVHYEMCLRLLREMPGHFHGALVAEHRDGPGRVGVVRRFTSSIRVLRSQEGYMAGRRHYVQAYRAGVAHLAQRHGLELFEELRQGVRRADRREVMGTVPTLFRFLVALLRWTPSALPSVVRVCLVPAATRRWSVWRHIESCAGSPAGNRRPSPLHEVRGTARTVIPAEASVLVVAEEADDEMLLLEGRRTQRLPPTRHLDDVRALEEFRRQGVDFLLVPCSAFWWLDHYHPGLKSQLEASRGQIWAGESGTVYSLAEASPIGSRRALVAGFFSFERGGATAGDLMARDVACDWLTDAGCPYDVAVAPPFGGGVDWRSVDPRRYSHVVFVCGPFLDNHGQRALLGRFTGSYLIGLNLSMPPLDGAGPFHLVLERDSAAIARPDISLGAHDNKVPVVGVCLREHAEGTRAANAAIRRLVASREMSVVEIDTRLDANTTGLRTPAEVESLLARMDVVVTTRLHGMVLALKNGVPVVAVDPQPGGLKIRRQAEALGWPIVLNVDAVTDEELQEAFRYCETTDARTRARECSDGAAGRLQELREAFRASL